MRRELEHFRIEGAYGWNQDWFTDWFMRMGGCAAVTACDSCIYFALRENRRALYPFDVNHLTRADYLRFSRQMKPFLRPRARGIDRLEIYQEGLGQYFQRVGERELSIGALSGERPYEEAESCVTGQIDAGRPIPFLLLKHRAATLSFYVWHWFLLMGYERLTDTTKVQAVTYGAWRWLDFRQLWDTGYREKGGMILFSFPERS